MLVKSIKFNEPGEITFDSRNQRILVMNNRCYNKIHCFDPNMESGEAFKFDKNSERLHIPRGICMQRSTNNIFVVDMGDYCIRVFSDREFQSLYRVGSSHSGGEPGNFNMPIGITCDIRSHILVTDVNTDRVQIFDEKGRFMRQIGTLGRHFNHPYSVCAVNNQILVTSWGNKKISIWSGDGSQFIREVNLDCRPYHVMFDNSNRLIVSFYSKLYILDAYFNIIQSIGGARGSQPTQFDGIDGICITDENNLIVSDHINNRFQLFKI